MDLSIPASPCAQGEPNPMAFAKRQPFHPWNICSCMSAKIQTRYLLNSSSLSIYSGAFHHIMYASANIALLDGGPVLLGMYLYLTWGLRSYDKIRTFPCSSTMPL